jgi:hypothetical protein
MVVKLAYVTGALRTSGRFEFCLARPDWDIETNS